MVISFEKEGLGSFTQEELDQIVVRDDSGRVVQLKLPQKAVLIANHQVLRTSRRSGVVEIDNMVSFR